MYDLKPFYSVMDEEADRMRFRDREKQQMAGQMPGIWREISDWLIAGGIFVLIVFLITSL
ncbi:hypothetical protein ACE6ED_10035 [Paenibacillus sp. CN-4]|uniref:hypothetical protein n=1 Tax=Paenibacillus nanchangensis TaxID=3348343 RepID=UPI0039785C36